MPRINLHHLHAFGIVAATGGIRRSADMLFRASSAVARSVTALEESLGTQLFERKGSGMLLTAAGQIVQLRVQRIEMELKEVRDDAVRLAARDGALIGSTDALFQVGGTVGALIVGFYMDRLTPNRVIATAYIGGAVFILMLASGSVTSSLFAAYVLLAGFCMSGAQTGMNAFAPSCYPTAVRATGVHQQVFAPAGAP